LYLILDFLLELQLVLLPLEPFVIIMSMKLPVSMRMQENPVSQ
jgi:hypothetical protein